jgi:hypothetical protein
MGLHWSDWPDGIRETLRAGCAIPASPLALTRERRFDPRHQRALIRYYLDAGAGGIAAGVHATQFAIREAGLYEPVLRTVIDTVESWTANREPVCIAGLAGTTEQALNEAAVALDLGYHAGLLSLAALRDASREAILAHCHAAAEAIPLIGFYLQPAVGGIVLDFEFWRRFAAIENVVAIKIAPFNRYRTLDVIRGVIAARAEDRIALYTGNDDHIVLDLVTPFMVMRDGEPVTVRIVGGLLGHWSVWTQRAVELHRRCRTLPEGAAVPGDLLALDSQVTDCNAAVFDVANEFRGCIPGCHEVLRRQGLLAGTWCLDPGEALSPGQAQEIDRVHDAYPHLNDDAFVSKNLERWLA